VDIWPGHWQPLGTTVDDGGTNFALFSANATAVDLCLFDDKGTETRVPLHESTFQVWHGYVPGVEAGTRYGYRVDGEFDPTNGARFNASKLLADPYARAFDGAFELDDAVFDNNPRDSAALVPKSVVVHDQFDWGEDRSPAVAWPDTRHLCRAGAPSSYRLPDTARSHHHRAPARAPLCQRAGTTSPRIVELLGLQHARLLRTTRWLFVVRHSW
jgi:pullulanase/glycogen debranching enzyme